METKETLWTKVSYSFQRLLMSVSFVFQSKSPSPTSPVILLAKHYSNIHTPEFIKDHKSRPWITYRNHFPPIRPSSYTCDSGWGCMLRTGQMMLCNAFIIYELGRNWCLNTSELSSYANIITRFLDSNQSPFSIHRIALLGQKYDKQIGEWFGPSTISHVLHSLLSEFNDCNLTMHVSSDGIIYKDSVYKAFSKEHEPDKNQDLNRGVFLALPLRLGLDSLNPVYYESLKSCFDMPFCIGIAGGRPNSSFFFLGYQADDLLYLDPHVLRPCIPQKDLYLNDDLETYQCSDVRILPISKMDPSMVIGFLLKSSEEFDQFCDIAVNISQGKTPLFNIEDFEPNYDQQDLELISDIDEI